MTARGSGTKERSRLRGKDTHRGSRGGVGGECGKGGGTLCVGRKRINKREGDAAGLEEDREGKKGEAEVAFCSTEA